MNINDSEFSNIQILEIEILSDMEKEVLRRIEHLLKEPFYNKRWVAIAKTNLEQGFMAAYRAITEEP